ncbi:hypothetical protein ATANTOWER_015140 [Ataeniobius toweri]|uniref:Reverse transcriptase domain-containing protein n=1 Tax=Ataeniobius toweri TaxID=208326 RepID=A0ABU7AJ99_9TELE|nr:hypothetical protein [Ataeniobius toweri]
MSFAYVQQFVNNWYGVVWSGGGCPVENLKVSSLPFADDVVLLTSLSHNLQGALNQFTAECKLTKSLQYSARIEKFVLLIEVARTGTNFLLAWSSSEPLGSPLRSLLQQQLSV